jgi:hypothetical protein
VKPSGAACGYSNICVVQQTLMRKLVVVLRIVRCALSDDQSLEVVRKLT